MGSTVHPNLPTVPRLKVVTQIPPMYCIKVLFAFCVAHGYQGTQARIKQAEATAFGGRFPSWWDDEMKRMSRSTMCPLAAAPGSVTFRDHTTRAATHGTIAIRNAGLETTRVILEALSSPVRPFSFPPPSCPLASSGPSRSPRSVLPLLGMCSCSG